MLYLNPRSFLKRLESPALYHAATDELYELDDEGFEFLLKASRGVEPSEGEREFIEFSMDEGILSEAPSTHPGAFRPPVTAYGPALPSLRYLELIVTRRCNLRCRHCYLGEARPIDLPVDDFISVLAEFEGMQGLRLLVSGGEPMMHPEWDRINEALKGRPFRRTVFTNGMLATPRALGKLNADEIQISIDGPEDAHDWLRGQGSWGRAMDAVDAALDAGLDVSVSTMAHVRALPGMAAFGDMLRTRGVREWNVDLPTVDNADIMPGPRDAADAFRHGFGSGLHGGGSGDYACGRHLMAVLPEGVCARCGFYADRPLGRLGEGLLECWRRVRHYRADELECAGCDVFAECRGGCRHRAAATGGSETSRDYHKCYFYGKIKSQTENF